MSGRVFVVLFAAIAAVFGGALWYFQVHAYYDQIEGVTSLAVAGQDIAVEDYRGIDAATSPNKLRACFRVDPAAFEGMPSAPEPEPLMPPAWFDCFDARTISDDLAAGEAAAYLAADETPDGAEGYEILRMIAVYPDGRGYLWRHYREAE
ncbi:MAG: DUF6446 family protein [Pseudomonadota bacterium]